MNAKAKERRRAAGNEELLPGRGERRPGFRPRWHAALPVLLALFIGVLPAQAQSAEPLRAVHRHTLRAGDYVADTFIPAMPRTYKNATPTAVFEVTYVDFPPGAQAAFQFAVDQWSWLVVSPVPIRIEATWAPLEEGILGSAGANLFANFNDAPERSRWYAAPLADALVARDLDDDDYDIFASFNSERSDWYFGTDGDTPRQAYDFASVVMHEIAHGLGFTASFYVNKGGFFDARCSGGEGLGCWGLNTDAGDVFAYVFDNFIEDRNGGFLLNELQYPNPSSILAEVLQSEAVVFASPSVEVANDGQGVLLYAPEPYETGSSLSHIDEDSYPAGDPNSLMSPFLGRAEAVFSPGPLTCAMLQDLGWAMGPDCLALMGSNIVSFDARRQGNTVLLTWEASDVEEIEAFRIEQRFFDEAFEEVRTVAVLPGGETTYSYAVMDLAPGHYAFRLIQLQADGSSLIGAQASIAVPLLKPVQASEVYPNPVSDQAQLQLQVQNTQHVRAALFDMQGRQVEVLADRVLQAQSQLRLIINARALSSGVYLVRVVGEDFVVTRTVVVVNH